jgi:hypothetical protein
MFLNNRLCDFGRIKCVNNAFIFIMLKKSLYYSKTFQTMELENMISIYVSLYEAIWQIYK